jgi:crotonobetainyl-CoA:carnitine CoA-transferase CaiB-like acyl-CoA transferase
MRGIYDGVRVVELASGIAAPYATMFLADHGADVVKVEAPAGDPYRSQAGFQTFNRNKRSAVLSPDGPELARLIAGADVLVTDAPGQALRLRAANPGALIVTMPPWGERGPYVERPATPDLVAAVAGIFWNQQSYTEAPVQIVVPLVAYGTAMLGALALAAGLFARRRDGVAPTFEVSWVAGAAAIQLGETQVVGAPVEERAGSAPMGSKGRVPCYRLFEAGDGRWCFLACGTLRFFHRLLELIGRPDLIGDPRLPDPPWGLVDLDAIAFVVPILEEAFATRPRAEWLAALRDADIPAQPVQTRDEYHASHLADATRVVHRLEHPDLGTVEMMGVPLVVEAAPGEVRRRAPRLGEHTADVCAELAAGAWPAQAVRPALAPGTAPLAGVRAIDLAGFIAGPVVSRHLAMLGVDVTKVEAPGGDPFRAFGPMFAAWNQGKRSVQLDLQQMGDRRLLHRLVESVDVVVENFRPGVATRLGCDDAALRAVNPQLVTLSSSGYGDDASMASVPAFDPLLQALGGIMAAQGGVSGPDDGGEPVFLTVAVHDVLTPLISAFGLVSALYDRLRPGGTGQRVRTSLAQTAVAAQAAELTRFAGAPEPPLGGFDYLGAGENHGCVPGDDGQWWFVEGDVRVPIVRTGLVNEPVATANDLCVMQDHPMFGEIVQFGQLVVGAGPPPGRGPLLDEHRAEVLGPVLGSASVPGSRPANAPSPAGAAASGPTAT